jgi:hypothetical protein
MSTPRLLLASLAVALGAGQAAAANLDIAATTRGFYRDSAGAVLGFSDPVGSYVVGRSGDVFRNFFVFSLPSLPTITAATLNLANPPLVFDDGTSVPGFMSDVGATEAYELRAITAPIATLLDPASDQSDAAAIFASIATGTLYGAAELSDQDAFGIRLRPAAIAALNSGAPFFALGGALASLNADPISQQAVFAFSGIFGSPVHATLTLSVAAVPEPSTMGVLLLLLGGACMAAVGLAKPRATTPI